MSMEHSVSVRIWLIDRLHPEKSFEEFSDFAEDIADNIYILNHDKLMQDASQHTRDGRMPIDKKLVLENHETVNVKELYFESASISMHRDILLGVDNKTILSYRCFVDWYAYPECLCMYRCVSNPDRKDILRISEYIEELYGDEHEELRGNPKGVAKDDDGDLLAHREWIENNPEWDFEKLVRDALPPFIIKFDLEATGK